MATRRQTAIRNRRAQTRARGGVRVPVQAIPINLEREYARAILSALQSAHAAVMRSIAGEFRADADKIVSKKIGAIKVEYYKKVSRKKRADLSKAVAARTNNFNKRAVGSQIKQVIGVNPLVTAGENFLPAVLDPFIKENVALIKTVADRYFDQVEKIVDESVAIGRRASDVSAMLQERFGVAETNANRIARDQINKLNGQLTEARQTNLGIKAYIWRTSRDERVRDTHQAQEGERFLWSDPPAETGHPGEDIQCRCRAEPDLSDLGALFD